jgi:hypothetical protein
MPRLDSGLPEHHYLNLLKLVGPDCLPIVSEMALSRAKRKMILVASRSIFSLFSPDEETFSNSLLWKNLLLRTCSTLLWEGERCGKRVDVWGGSAKKQ